MGYPYHSMIRRARLAEAEDDDIGVVVTKGCFLASEDEDVKTRLSWVTGMFALSTVYILGNWYNFLAMSSPTLAYDIFIGPPTFNMWATLLAFTCIATITYIMESVNTFSVFCHDGRTIVPLIYESLLTLPISRIPLAGTNYFISRCRHNETSLLQTLVGACDIAFIFVRFIWYAHMEGRALRQNDKHKLKKVLFMCCCALFAICMAFPSSAWSSLASAGFRVKHLTNVSIVLMKNPAWENKLLYRETVTTLIQSQGYTISEPYLVPNVYSVTQSDYGYNVSYSCNTNTTTLPLECLNNTDSLLFHFKYSAHYEDTTYGSISYNYARVWKDNCEEIANDLQDDWKLWYFSVQKWSHRGQIYINYTHPWAMTCTAPRPRFEPSLKIC